MENLFGREDKSADRWNREEDNNNQLQRVLFNN